MTLNEKATRKQFIDRALLDTGWGPILCFDAHERYNHASVDEYSTSKGPADYVLFSNGQPIAIVEAKKLLVVPQNVLQQAQRYALGFEGGPFGFIGFHVPLRHQIMGNCGRV
jgi:type I restriction enzyme R subunit